MYFEEVLGVSLSKKIANGATANAAAPFIMQHNVLYLLSENPDALCTCCFSINITNASIFKEKTRLSQCLNIGRHHHPRVAPQRVLAVVRGVRASDRYVSGLMKEMDLHGIGTTAKLEYKKRGKKKD